MFTTSDNENVISYLYKTTDINLLGSKETNRRGALGYYSSHIKHSIHERRSNIRIIFESLQQYKATHYILKWMNE